MTLVHQAYAFLKSLADFPNPSAGLSYPVHLMIRQKNKLRALVVAALGAAHAGAPWRCKGTCRDALYPWAAKLGRSDIAV